MAKKTANQILAERLDHFMKLRGFNNSTLGKKAGIAPNTVGNYLDKTPQVTATGKERSAKLAEIERLADVLEVSIVDLLTEADERKPEPRVLPPKVEQMLEDLSDLPGPKQSKIIDMIHNDAEEARAAAAHLMARNRVPVTQPAKAIGHASSVIKIKYGDGNPDQGALDLHMVDDPFNSEPSAREADWYEQLAKAGKHTRA
jgi:DNA-binding Xre family transcriptional regulator